ncbi:UxaA family hydrolase [Sodalis ligni]|jgi:altronate dehydratase large subunit|uniref:UxaA family hydrolase n=1 Tax=Sodalis TaxID=84565 RepID=UPI00193F609F|nr:UxaA family hydrolase [Sodalis ligni]QWA10955.1 UxaA family hydrolase [Sodalis ligni]
MSMTFKGYRRPDGSVGIRNHVLILPTSACSNKVARDISLQVKGAVWINNNFGCCQIASDAKLTVKTLINVAANGNVGAVVVVGLGCEGAEPTYVTDEIRKTGKPVCCVTIQGEGGTLNCQAKGISLARAYAQELSMQQGEAISLAELTLGMECGGSDTTSGLISNPSLGVACDRLIAEGGTAMLSETTEFIGAEQVFAKRAVNPRVAKEFIDMVLDCEQRAKALGEDIRGGQPTPGNIKGGLTTIEEKSLGCIHKAGHSPLQGVLKYADRPQGHGLWVMDTPGQDIESLSGKVAGGANLIVFTTGRGSPTGTPIAPVIKITANEATYAKMSDNIDLDVSAAMRGEATIEEMGQRVFDEILKVANGKSTKAEELGHDEFSIYKIAPSF